jgi:hypothetical protein
MKVSRSSYLVGNRGVANHATVGRRSQQRLVTAITFIFKIGVIAEALKRSILGVNGGQRAWAENLRPNSYERSDYAQD